MSDVAKVYNRFGNHILIKYSIGHNGLPISWHIIYEWCHIVNANQDFFYIWLQRLWTMEVFAYIKCGLVTALRNSNCMLYHSSKAITHWSVLIGYLHFSGACRIEEVILWVLTTEYLVIPNNEKRCNPVQLSRKVN